MATNINEFLKGVNSDIDVLRIDNQTPRDMQNMRVIDVDGKGLVLTNIAGNEEKFDLNNGFIPIGSVEYNGIIYIASFCPPNGRGEIGCYPAPEALIQKDCSLSGWDNTDKQYAPLFNFTSNLNPRDPLSVPQVFSTELFNFGEVGVDKISQVDMIAREDYDGSVNLYLCGEKNPIRVFNSGFDQNGECTKLERRYWNGSFPNEVNLLNESEKHLEIEFLGTGEAGRLRGGSYIFFFRYVNENYDTTSFFAETNSVIIMPGKWEIEGWRRMGIEGIVETTKSVNLRIKNVDPTYSYLEIGFQHNNDDTFEYGILTERIALDPALSTYDVSITGNEEYYNVDVSDIIRTKPTWNGARSHEQLENRYFAADVFDTTDLNDERIREIAEFTSLITPNYDDTQQLQHREEGPGFFDDAVGSNYYRGIYNKEENVYNYTGYFRGESYPFGVVYVLNTGREIGAFPVKGRDDWKPTQPILNDEGVYRFPTTSDSNPVTGNFINVLGIKFNITAAIAALPQWMQDNISGLYFVRGKRQRSLLYQGLIVPTFAAVYNGNKFDFANQNPFLFNYKPKDILQTENMFPSFSDGYMQYLWAYDENLIADQVLNLATSNVFYSEKTNKSAIFSIDHFFLKSVPINRGYIIQIGRYDTEGGTYKGDDNVTPGERYFIGDENPSNFTRIIRGNRDVINVAPWESTNNSLFVSYYKEGTKTEYKSFVYYYARSQDSTKFFEIRNAETAYPSYIGVELNTEVDYWWYNVVNLYLADPRNANDGGDFEIEKLYDVKSTSYSKISKFYRLSDLIANPLIVNNDTQYKGDCFFQRSLTRIKTNSRLAPSMIADGFYDSGAPIGFDPFDIKSYGFGQVVARITENQINAECRLETPTEKFAPGSTPDIYNFAIKNTERESELYNRGYNEQLSSKTYRGINLEIPFFKDDKPSAIMYSNVHNLGSFQDGYRLIDIAAIREYDYRLGRIVSIKNHNGTLISIQEFGINKHLVNNRALLNQGDSSGELLLGSGQILDSKALNLSDYIGSQHQWSIVKTDYSLYGFDFNKRKIWRLNAQFQVEPVSDTKSYKTETYRICEFNTTDSDITEGLPDYPVSLGGIVAYYDKKYHDIYFTIIKNKEGIEDNQVVFNEMTDSFNGKRTFKSPYGFTINEDFFTFNPDLFASTQPNPQTFLGDAWIHGVKKISTVDNSTCFYGKVDADISYVEFIVNNPADIAKVFDKIDISSAPIDLYKVSFETQHQLVEHFPFVEGTNTSFWRDPRYEENLWRLPIPRAQTIQEPANNIYETESRLRGRWLKVRLEYKTKNSIFIKSVLTDFRKSNY